MALPLITIAKMFKHKSFIGFGKHITQTDIFPSFSTETFQLTMDWTCQIPPGAQPALRELPEELVAAGFCIRNDFVSVEEETMLLRDIDARPWERQLSRRTQHYGWRFEYTSKSCVRIDESIPATFRRLVLDRLRVVANCEIMWLDGVEDNVQCTVNEYQRGQGIAPHVDTHAAFDDGILALSLGSGVGLRLRKVAGDIRHPNYNVWLERRSLITYVGEARYAFAHGIISRKGDLLDSQWVLRNRRVSVTFRNLPRRPKCATCLTQCSVDCECACHHCRCRFPSSCDARPGGASKRLPTRICAATIPSGHEATATRTQP